MLMLPRMAALDTSERDALFDVLGLHLTGCPWPRSGGTEAPGGSWLILITQWSRPAGKCYLRRGRIALVCWPPCQSILVQRCREILIHSFCFSSRDGRNTLLGSGCVGPCGVCSQSGAVQHHLVHAILGPWQSTGFLPNRIKPTLML